MLANTQVEELKPEVVPGLGLLAAPTASDGTEKADRHAYPYLIPTAYDHVHHHDLSDGVVSAATTYRDTICEYDLAAHRNSIQLDKKTSTFDPEIMFSLLAEYLICTLSEDLSSISWPHWTSSCYLDYS